MGMRSRHLRRGPVSGQMDHGMYAAPSPGVVLISAKVSSRQVQIMSTLPLKAISRLWGKFNELDIPYYLRIPGFRLYSYIFGVK
jgi:hypothetical protein